MTGIKESHSPQNTGLIAASAATAPVAVVAAEPGRYRRVGGRGQTAGGRRALSQLEETLTETPVERLDGRGRQLSMHLQTVLQDCQLTGRGAQWSHRGQTCCPARGHRGHTGVRSHLRPRWGEGIQVSHRAPAGTSGVLSSRNSHDTFDTETLTASACNIPPPPLLLYTATTGRTARHPRRPGCPLSRVCVGECLPQALSSRQGPTYV